MASLKEIPVIGETLYDVRQGIHGNPDEVKAAYDKQIQASKDAQERQMRFLMGAKGDAQELYLPMKNMFQRMYGSAGIDAPMIPGQSPPGTGGGRIEGMFQQQQPPPAGAPAPPPVPKRAGPGGGNSYGGTR